MSERQDIVVIGSGIIGVSAALHLLHEGRKVLLIDRRGPGQETSYGNAGVLGSGYVVPFGFPSWRRFPAILLDRDPAARIRYASLPHTLPWIVKFYFQSLPEARRRNGKLVYPLIVNATAEHRDLMQNTDAEKHLSLGKQVTLYRSEKSFAQDELVRSAARELNVPFEVMDAMTFREIEPHLKPIFDKVVRWPASSQINNPGAVVTAYAARFTREGGSWLQAEAEGMTSTGQGWTIRTSQGEISTQQVVLCAGPWTSEMLKPLGYHFPMAMKRGYHQHYRSLAPFTHAITDFEQGYVIVPMEQGYRVTTGAEFADLDSPPTPVQLDRILPRARELFPIGEAVEPVPWHGNRPCFTDSLPVIGPAPRHPGLWLNFGHGHIGMTTGPSSGRLVAELICGKWPFCDPHPYRAERFSC